MIQYWERSTHYWNARFFASDFSGFLNDKNNPAAAAAKSLQSCPTLRPHRRQPTRLPRPWDSPGKNTAVSCHFLFQRMKVKSEKWKWSCSVVSDSATPWTAAYQAPLSMGFSRQECWSGLPFPSPLLWYDYILINYICNDPVFKECHIWGVGVRISIYIF